MTETSPVVRFLGFVIPSSFDIRLPRRSWVEAGASSFSRSHGVNREELQITNGTRGKVVGFTIVELLVVITIIIILAGLILSTVGYVQKKGARSRAETEIAAMSAALESYKADNGIYPKNTDTDNLDPVTAGNPASYSPASLFLYGQLSGEYDNNNPTATTNYDRKIDGNETGKSYFSFKPNQLSPTDQTQNVAFIRDPFGNSFGYSTAKASAPSGSAGYNPTFDLWSTDGTIDTNNPPNQTQWIKNW